MMVSVFLFIEEYQEFLGYGCLKLHLLPGDGMVEIETIGVERQAVQRVAPVAILLVSGHRVAQVGHVHTYLVLAPCLQFHLNERKVVGAAQTVVMCYGQFAAIVSRRGIGNEGLALP